MDMIFFSNGKDKIRIREGNLREAKKKESSLLKIYGDNGDYRWMYKCKICGLSFFEDEDPQIKETGICKKCQEDEPELELDHDEDSVSMVFWREK